MTTLAQLADLAQTQLSDSGAGTWAQADVEAFAVDVIREYSTHFHRTRTHNINAASGTNTYDLPDDFIAMLSVEYPEGEDPPVYLARFDHVRAEFWESDDYYDVTPTDEAPNQGTLWIGVEPVGTERIGLTYLAPHDTSLASGDTITVPDHHIPVLIKGIIARAFLERLSLEEQSPDTTLYLIREYKEAHDQARAQFLDAIAGAKANQPKPAAFTRPWPVDRFDRIY